MENDFPFFSNPEAECFHKFRQKCAPYEKYQTEYITVHGQHREEENMEIIFPLFGMDSADYSSAELQMQRHLCYVWLEFELLTTKVEGVSHGVNSTAQDIAIQDPIASAEHSHPWLAPWQAATLVVLIGLLYGSILWNLVGQWWTDPNFSHGFFVPMFSAFIVWRDRERLAQIPIRQSSLGLPVIIGALITLMVGVLGAEFFLSRSSLILLVGALIIYFAGWPLFRALLFPWFFLFLMIPIPSIVFNQITLPLQFLASQLSADILRVLGVPVLREGNVIMLPNMPLEVAEACSGIRSLMSLGTMAIIYGYLADNRLWRRVALVLVAVPVAVAANAIRIVGTGLTVQYWDPDKGQGFFHEFSGWLIFIVSLGMLLILHWVLRRFDRSNPRRAA